MFGDIFCVYRMSYVAMYEVKCLPEPIVVGAIGV